MDTVKEIILNNPGIIRQVFVISCADCQKILWSFARYKRAVAASAEDDGWREISGKWYCPKCYVEIR